MKNDKCHIIGIWSIWLFIACITSSCLCDVIYKDNHNYPDAGQRGGGIPWLILLTIGGLIFNIIMTVDSFKKPTK
jgi:hypothetical protein